MTLFVQYIDRTYRRIGTSWEGRFRFCLTQSEDYAPACYSYIELVTPHDQYQKLASEAKERRLDI